jgi:hypothetical protein
MASQPSSSSPPDPSDEHEVRSYLLKLLAVIAVAIVVMTSVAVWAWRAYGPKLDPSPGVPIEQPPIPPRP